MPLAPERGGKAWLGGRLVLRAGGSHAPPVMRTTLPWLGEMGEWCGSFWGGCVGRTWTPKRVLTSMMVIRGGLFRTEGELVNWSCWMLSGEAVEARNKKCRDAEAQWCRGEGGGGGGGAGDNGREG